jgi:hypothetical protein
MITIELFRYPGYWAAAPSHADRMARPALGFSAIGDTAGEAIARAGRRLVEVGCREAVLVRPAQDEWTRAAWARRS